MPESFLVVAPAGRDAAVVVAMLRSAGIAATPVTGEQLLAAIHDNSIGAAILTNEALDAIAPDALRDALVAQAPWSDCPILLLVHRNAIAGVNRTDLVDTGNVVLLERPLHPATLTAAAHTALRGRTRQRKAEVQLLAREEAEAQVRDFAATLEARVNTRTVELTQQIAKRADAEARLRASEENYRFTIDLSGQIPWTSSNSGTLLGIGDRWTEITGMTLEESLGYGWHKAVNREDLEQTQQLRDESRINGTPLDFSTRLLMRDGSYRWFRGRASPRFDADGNMLRWYGTLEDIDDRRQAEARLAQLQSELIHVSRLSAMGTMASTLAHELNQPLTAIGNYMRGCRRLLADMSGETLPVVRDALAEADSCAVRAGEIVRRLRELVERGEVRHRAEDLPTLIRESRAIALIDAGARGIEYSQKLDPRADRVDVDRIQIQQVMLNLLRNAVEAMDTAPVRKISVATRRIKGFCEVSVCDTGPGIDPVVAARLFEPFNTSKPDGMGIGLSISRTIVEAHGGQIWTEPGPDGGTVFRFTLPVA
jgi:two-component system sensor kinase FixL